MHIHIILGFMKIVFQHEEEEEKKKKEEEENGEAEKSEVTYLPIEKKSFWFLPWLYS